MNYDLVLKTIDYFAKIDPSLFFIGSLIPYLFFLKFASQSTEIPKPSLIGFQLTLVFVLMTIICSIIAILFFGDDLTNIDPLHGSAEAFLALSDGFILFGFLNVLRENR